MDAHQQEGRVAHVLRGTEAARAELVDAHTGAMRRLARLAGRDADADDVVRKAWAAAWARPDDQPGGVTARVWLLRLVLEQLATAASNPEVDSPAPAADFEDEGGRWAGWWRDDLPATPRPDSDALEQALLAIGPGLAVVLVLRDVEGLTPAEVEALVALAPAQQVAVLQRARAAVRTALRAGAGGP